jgi:hypothetical protein
MRLLRAIAGIGVAVLLAFVLFMGSSQTESAGNGAQVLLGSGERGVVTFKFTVVFTPSGKLNGTFFADNPDYPNIYPITGNIDCGWVAGDTAVFGGTDKTSGEGFTVLISDDPDGLTFGDGRPNCLTSGFGGAIPITEGRIRIINGS